MSIFVGALQCVLPLFLLLRFGGDPSVVQAAFPVFLFGFTYLYVGIAALTGISTEGIGWFFFLWQYRPLVLASCHRLRGISRSR
nr:AmiS/UreI family transporter [uncultured Arthrobacter sp.]